MLAQRTYRDPNFVTKQFGVGKEDVTTPGGLFGGAGRVQNFAACSNNYGAEHPAYSDLESVAGKNAKVIDIFSKKEVAVENNAEAVKEAAPEDEGLAGNVAAGTRTVNPREIAARNAKVPGLTA